MEHLLVEIEPDNVILVGESLDECLRRVTLDGDFHWAIEILAHLFDQVVLITNHGTVVHKIIGGVIENESRDSVAMDRFLFFVLVFDRNGEVNNTPVPNDKRCQ